MAPALWTSILVATFVVIFLSTASGKYRTEAQDKGRARRIADAQMNARLLRLNI